MKPDHRIRRREFLQNACLGASSLLARSNQFGFADAAFSPVGGSTDMMPPLQVSLEPTQNVWITREPGSGFQEQLAARELSRGLRNLVLAREPTLALTTEGQPSATALTFSLLVAKQAFKHPEGYEISNETTAGQAPRVRLSAATPQAVLYAVFDFLERQGAFFGLDGEVYPLDAARALNLPQPGSPWRAQPRFDVRGTLPWPDFLNCVSVYNREDFRAYLESLLRMRFNTLGIHVYSMAKQWTESFLSFEYAGAGHLAYTDTTATNRWGYIPERTSRYGMGSPQFYASEVFGSEVTTQARNCWEAAELAQQLWREAFRYAEQLGIRTGVGFEPYSVPDEIVQAVPPEALFKKKDPKDPGPPIDPESVAAKDILETRLGQLLEAYPNLDYVWLWEDEESNWASQKVNIPLSVTPFRQAHDFLKRQAPAKRLVISGWGGVVRHFAYFHQHLPGDVIFTSLNDSLGWDLVSEEYAKLEGRERWPIPWLEDDPGMWLPQFHVHRLAEDMDRAKKFGCQGLLGIHWRHRIMEANSTFQSRRSWDESLKPEPYFQALATAQARAPRAEKLGQVLNDTDQKRLILCSWSGEIKEGHHQIHEYSGDYDEAFEYWSGYEPSADVKKSQAAVGQELRKLTEAASSPAEKERLNYLARHIEFLTPYSESWSLAYHLDLDLKKAKELKSKGQADEAKKLVMSECVPRWLKLAPLVRETLLDFQEIVSTRSDQGTLASMHNKYERLALYRLRASLKEFLGDLPPETERMFEEVRRPEATAAPRVFVPTRPTLLRPGDQVRLWAVAPHGDEVNHVVLYTRMTEAKGWHSTPMRPAGRRRTFLGELACLDASRPLLDYYVEAEFRVGAEKTLATAPLEAPGRFYTATLVSP